MTVCNTERCEELLLPFVISNYHAVTLNFKNCFKNRYRTVINSCICISNFLPSHVNSNLNFVSASKGPDPLRARRSNRKHTFSMGADPLRAARSSRPNRNLIDF
jgi:hypothetical protein